MARRDSLLCQQHQDDGRYYSPRHVDLLVTMILLLALQKMVDCYSPAVLIEIDSVRARICANRARIICTLAAVLDLYSLIRSSPLSSSRSFMKAIGVPADRAAKKIGAQTDECGLLPIVLAVAVPA
ncbi:hypothetical protein, partial [Mesorhizobium sp.]|uniref:hypothetical protein n=1 Tax=Mesorhizobium sp. TaxID=1871066 RepID=UPI002580074C